MFYQQLFSMGIKLLVLQPKFKIQKSSLMKFVFRLFPFATSLINDRKRALIKTWSKFLPIDDINEKINKIVLALLH